MRGSLTMLAKRHPKTFAGLLGRVLPLHVVEEEEPRVVVHRSREEIIQDMRQRGFPTEMLDALSVDPNAGYVPNHKLSKPPSGTNGSGAH